MSFDARKNFAITTVATAPSPATSGTSLVVNGGDGTKFAAASFNAIVWPSGANPNAGNAEVVRVTAIATDTFTITRTQEGSTARTIVVGDQIMAGLTNKTLADIEAAFASYAALATYDPANIAQQVLGTTAAQAVTNKDFTGGGNTWPTFNQNTTGTAGNVTGTVAVVNGGTGVTISTGTGANVLGTSPTFTTGFTLNAGSIVTDTTTGLKIGTGTTQKLGFFGVTGVVQQAAATDLGTTLSNLGLRAAGSTYSITTSGTVSLTGYVSAPNINQGLTSTVTAAGTTTLVYTSPQTQIFTGTTTQTVTLPTTSVAVGWDVVVINQSTGLVTVKASGGTTVQILAPLTHAVITALAATPTTNTQWDSRYLGDNVATGKVLTVNNSLTLAGTDGTTQTMPSSSDTLVGRASTDALTNKDVSSSTNVFPSTLLGYAQITTTQTGIGGSPTNITGLTVTVTVPTGGRSIELTCNGFTYSSATCIGIISFVEGTTQVGASIAPIFNAVNGMPWIGSCVITPSAGSHTYKIMYQVTAGTGQVIAGTNSSIGGNPPAYIAVKLL